MWRPFSELEQVRVIKLEEEERPFDGKRPPTLGDTGRILRVHDPDDPTAPLTVENVDPEGDLIWLADFSPLELEPVSRPSNGGPEGRRTSGG